MKKKKQQQQYNTHGKNLNALTSNSVLVNASRISSSVHVDLQKKLKKNSLTLIIINTSSIKKYYFYKKLSFKKKNVINLNLSFQKIKNLFKLFKR